MDRLYNEWKNEEKLYRDHIETQKTHLILFMFQITITYIYFYALFYNFIILTCKLKNKMKIIQK